MAEEKQFENKVKKYLQSVGVYALGTPDDKMPVTSVGYYEKRHGNMFTKKGLPDLHICIHGKSIDVELKAQKGLVDEMQLFMLKQINTCGGCGVLLYPSHFEQFKTLIRDYL